MNIIILLYTLDVHVILIIVLVLIVLILRECVIMKLRMAIRIHSIINIFIIPLNKGMLVLHLEQLYIKTIPFGDVVAGQKKILPCLQGCMVGNN